MTHIEEARKLADRVVGLWITRRPQNDAAAVIATALAAAEERGRMEERGRCAQIAAESAPYSEDAIANAGIMVILANSYDVAKSRLARKIAAAITKEPTP